MPLDQAPFLISLATGAGAAAVVSAMALNRIVDGVGGELDWVVARQAGQIGWDWVAGRQGARPFRHRAQILRIRADLMSTLKI